MRKKEFLDYLYYELGKQQYDFYLCGLHKVGDMVRATKWVKYSELCFPLDPWEDYKLGHINQRQILPNEVVLDLEDTSTINFVIAKLKEKKAFFYNYATGSKGYHIHLFFKRALNEVEKLQIINNFGADPQKASPKTMIALEFSPHWKSGKVKELIQNGI
jgi:hypothetical protein